MEDLNCTTKRSDKCLKFVPMVSRMTSRSDRYAIRFEERYKLI